jgi:RNA polymerase sigma-70 factor, ECF subfamily
LPRISRFATSAFQCGTEPQPVHVCKLIPASPKAGEIRVAAGDSQVAGEAVEKLPDAYRTIFMLRDVEDMSTTDAADVLEITEDNVKVRLHRARALLRKRLYARAGMERKEAFNFHVVRCDRVVKNVFERIQKQVPKTGTSAAKTE